jgi:hypothetical protein
MEVIDIAHAVLEVLGTVVATAAVLTSTLALGSLAPRWKRISRWLANRRSA